MLRRGEKPLQLVDAVIPGATEVDGLLGERAIGRDSQSGRVEVTLPALGDIGPVADVPADLRAVAVAR